MIGRGRRPGRWHEFFFLLSMVHAIRTNGPASTVSSGDNLSDSPNSGEIVLLKRKHRRKFQPGVVFQQQKKSSESEGVVGAEAEPLQNNPLLQKQPYEDVRNKFTTISTLDESEEIANTEIVMPDLRIINGVSAPETRYPYAASLQYNGQHFCGGSLVSPNIVITAAHCTTTPAKITLGRYDLDSDADYDYEILDVVKKIIHPNYDKTVVENDLALLVLERDSIHPYIRINVDSSVPSDGEKLAVMGWGDVDSSDYGQKTSDELRETGVWYMTNSKCEESEGYVKTNEGVLFGNYLGSITDSMMCAIDNIGTTSDACQGDSGGGLVRTGSVSSADVLVGLVSWGFGCADPNFPGVYSRLSAYYSEFLQPNICQNSRSPPSYFNCNSASGSGHMETAPPVSAPDGLLTIYVDTDPFNPEDLGWELTSVPDGAVIASRPIGHYANRYGAALAEEVNVGTERFYRLTIYDRDKDGFRGEITVVRGRRYVKSDALVYEPGFSQVSGGSVVHGFYVGYYPPRELTLDLTFDSNPEDLAWSVTNVEDDLPLGFKWFDWYSKNFIKATEKIPIYGADRGLQEYIFTVLDLNGNGMCCNQGVGKFSLYLGDSVIASGGEFTTDQSFRFEVNSAGMLNSPSHTHSNPTQNRPTRYPTRKPISLSETSGYYMAPATGICQVNGASKPTWLIQIFPTYDECCQFSWNKQQCFAAKPEADESIFFGNPPTYIPTSLPQIYSPIPVDSDGAAIAFTPVTGSFTCRAAGMACTIKCSNCGTIDQVVSSMAMEFPNDHTIIYTVERGTDYFPEEPSRLILVESDSAAESFISCDVGCTCKSVGDGVVGCGSISNPIEIQLKPLAPSPMPSLETINCSVNTKSSFLLIACMPLVLCKIAG